MMSQKKCASDVDYRNLRKKRRCCCNCDCIRGLVSSNQLVVGTRNVTVDILTILFATSSWIGINGLFVQLPLLVQTQPEQWNLPSYIAVVIQAGNIGPVCYSLLQSFLPGRVKDSSIILILLVVGSVSLLLFALFYKESVFLLGKQRSLTIFILVFFIAVVGCTSSVLFMPYMSNFHEIYLISYFVGEGFSGFVPSLVALVQGTSGNPNCINETQIDGTVLLVPVASLPRFSTYDFFLFIFVIMMCSTSAFLILNYVYASKAKSIPVARSKYHTRSDVLKCYELEYTISDSKNTNKPSIQPLKEIVELRSSNIIEVERSLHKNNQLQGDLMNSDSHTRRSCNFMQDGTNEPLSHSMNVMMLLVVVWVCLLGNGFLPSIQSYSCLPYGNVVYHLSATLGSMANPAACFLAFFMPVSSVCNIVILTFLGSLTSSYITFTAFASPEPPLLHTIIGDILVVLCWILNTGIISYVKMSTASLFRQQSARALFWCGASQQVGSAIGALIAFTLTNLVHSFTSYNPC